MDTNPVSRLYEILREAQQQDAGTAAKYAWGKVFGVDSTEDLLQSMAALIVLVRDAKAAVSEADLNEELYMSPFAHVEQMLATMNLEQQWGRFNEQLTPTVMQALHFGADAVAKTARFRSLSEEQRQELEDLLEEVEELRKDVTSSGLPAELIVYVVAKLEDVRRAIIEFRLTGFEGLQNVLDETLGGLLRQRGLFEEFQDEPPVRRFRNVLRRLGAVLGFGIQAGQLTTSVLLLLTDGSSK
jgi:hypothetical protein